MIYLFDKCYLSLPHQIVEDAVHVWVGELNVNANSFFDSSFNVYAKIDKLTNAKIDKLFEDVHEELSDKKTVIYCNDVDSFLKVYGFFFGSILSKEGLNALYNYDRLKENYGISENSNVKIKKREIIKLELPEHEFKLRTFSSFAKTVGQIRVEIALANNMTEYCLSRVGQMYKGTGGYSQEYIESIIPALIDNFTIDNLTPENLQECVEYYSQISHVPNLTDNLQTLLNMSIIDHYVDVINDGDMSDSFKRELQEKYGSEDKSVFIEEILLNPEYAKNYNLIFPNISNFDSINPIFWNDIFKNLENSQWIDKFKLNYGTDNQTDGTV